MFQLSRRYAAMLVLMPSIAFSQAAQSGAEPKWPLSFELGAGEQVITGFVVGQPGPIVVKAEWRGGAGPMIASLIKPGGGSIDQPGNGSATIQYTATPDEVKRGVIWLVRLRFAQGSSRSTAGTTPVTTPVRKDGAPTVTGLMTVTHPAADLARAQQEAASAKAQRPASSGGTAKPDFAAQRLTAIRGVEMARQNQALERLRSGLSAEAYTQQQAIIAARGAGRAAAMAAEAPLTTARSAPATKTGRFDTGSQTTTTTTTKSANTGTGAIATVMATPKITALSVSSGAAGDVVGISGGPFGARTSEHRTGDAVLTVDGATYNMGALGWTDTQLIMSVPAITGVRGGTASIFVNRASETYLYASNVMPFTFKPDTETMDITAPDDRLLRGPLDKSAPSGFVAYDFWFLGASGNDEFFKNLKLKNGWVADSYYLTRYELTNGPAGWSEYPGIGVSNGIPGITSGATADVIEFQPGGVSPYVKVHWSAGAFDRIVYSVHVIIKGPKGLPWK